MKTRLYLFFFFASTLGFGQQSPLKLPPNLLQQDFSLLRNVLSEVHPHPNRIYDTQSFIQQLDRYESMLSDSLTALQFFQIVSSAMSNVGEAHTGVDISDEIKDQIRTNGRLFPLDIHFYNKKAYVLNDHTTESQKLNRYEIISINGKGIDKIIDITDSVSCLGTVYNRTRIYRKLSYLRNFALSYYLYVDQSPSFLIEYREPGKDQVRATVIDGIRPDFEISTTLSPPETTPPYSLVLDKTRDLAIIKIKTFAHFIIGYKQKEYHKFYRDAFNQIAKAGITNLAIDIRGNRGGQEKLGAHLLSYLMDKPLKVHDYVFTKSLDHLLLDSLGIFHHSPSTKRFHAVDSGYVVTDSKHDLLYTIDPVKKDAFKGDTYFLVDGECFSACNIFAALANYHNIGTIIGEESGGNYQDSEGYPGAIFKLPNSGLGIDFRLWHLRTAVESPAYGRGIIPDIRAQPTVDDVIKGTDVYIEKVYELIEPKTIDN